MNRGRAVLSLAVCIVLALISPPRVDGKSKVGTFFRKVLEEALSARYITNVRVVSSSAYSTTFEVSYANVPDPSQRAFKAIVHASQPAGSDDFQATYAGLDAETGASRLTISLKKSTSPQPVQSEKIEILLVNRFDGATIDSQVVAYAQDWGRSASPGGLPDREEAPPAARREIEIDPIPRGNTPRDPAVSDRMGELVIPPQPRSDGLPAPSAAGKQAPRGDADASPSNPALDSQTRVFEPSLAPARMLSLSDAPGPKVNLYALASGASWRNNDRPIRFNDPNPPGDTIVRPVGSALLSDGQRYSSVLMARPGISKGSSVVGTYEVTIPPDAFVFETSIGFLEESFSNEKVTFIVSFYSESIGSNTYLMREQVDQPQGVIARSISLPHELLGKRGQLVLEVDSRAASDGNHAVWVFPRIR